MLAVLSLCACATLLAVAADSKNRAAEEARPPKPKPKAKAVATAKSHSTAANPATKSASTPKSAAKPAAAPAPSPSVSNEKKLANAESPKAKPAEKGTAKAAPPAAAETPKMTTPVEPPPRDVTSTNRASGGSVDSKSRSEFDREEAEEDAREKAAASRNKGTATTSSDMAGWELIRYQERDYVAASSIHKFYRFNTLDVNGNNVWFRSPVLVMKATIGSQDLLINNIKFVLSDPVLELKGKPCFSRLDLCKLIDPVLRPSYIGSGSTFDTVILDPGHGGHDSGARGIYGYEKDFALKLAFAVKTDLEKRGLKVVMTRRDDTFLSLGARVAYANKIPNSIYVSLHFNSGSSSATGIETFALTPQGASSVYGARSVDVYSFNGNQRDSENIALATAIHASVVHHFRFVDRGVKRARWYVLKGLERPGVLFEGGFVTNASDAKFIAADNFRQELAATLGQAIMNYRRALKPR